MAELWLCQVECKYEFPERLGAPGFPTVEAFKENPYAGPKISYTDYLFGLHTPFQVVSYHLFGWVKIIGYQALSLSPLSVPTAIAISSHAIKGMGHLLGPSLMLAFFLGLIALGAWFRLLPDRMLWWVPPMLFWGTFYAAFLYHIGLVEPIRHVVHVYPLLVLVTVWGVKGVWESAAALGVVKYVRISRLQKL